MEDVVVAVVVALAVVALAVVIVTTNSRLRKQNKLGYDEHHVTIVICSLYR